MNIVLYQGDDEKYTCTRLDINDQNTTCVVVFQGTHFAQLT